MSNWRPASEAGYRDDGGEGTDNNIEKNGIDHFRGVYPDEYFVDEDVQDSLFDDDVDSQDKSIQYDDAIEVSSSDIAVNNIVSSLIETQPTFDIPKSSAPEKGGLLRRFIASATATPEIISEVDDADQNLLNLEDDDIDLSEEFTDYTDTQEETRTNFDKPNVITISEDRKSQRSEDAESMENNLPAPAPRAGIISRGSTAVSTAINDWLQERSINKEQFKSQLELQRVQAIEERDNKLAQYKTTEKGQLEYIKQQARLHRMYPSVIERPKDLGLKHHRELADLTRAQVAKQLERHTGVNWDNRSDTLSEVEVQQTLAVIGQAVERARGVYKVDDDTELDPARRSAVIGEAATANKAQIARALRVALPEIYVFDAADYDQEGSLILSRAAVKHREHAFETTALSKEVDLEPHEWDIGFHNREIRVTSRLILDGERYGFDPSHDGISKLLGALGTTIENQHPEALGFRTSGLIKFDQTQDDKSPEQTRLGGAANYIGGAVVSARFAGVEVEETIPEFSKPQGLLQLLAKDDELALSIRELSVNYEADMDDEEPTFIASMTVEARHVTSDTFAWLLSLHKERTTKESNEDVPYQDQTAYATFFADAIHKVAIPNLKLRADHIRHANYLAAQQRNNYLNEVGLSGLTKPMPSKGMLPPPAPGSHGLPLAPPNHK